MRNSHWEFATFSAGCARAWAYAAPTESNKTLVKFSNLQHIVLFWFSLGIWEIQFFDLLKQSTKEIRTLTCVIAGRQLHRILERISYTVFIDPIPPPQHQTSNRPLKMEENIDIIMPDENEERESEQVPSERRITTPYMTKYERARVLGTRALQIAMCAPVMVELEGKRFRWQSHRTIHLMIIRLSFDDPDNHPDNHPDRSFWHSADWINWILIFALICVF